MQCFLRGVSLFVFSVHAYTVSATDAVQEPQMSHPPKMEEVQKSVVHPSLVPVYNAPVPTDLVNSFHVFSDVSFIYWKAFQNEMQTYTLYSLLTVDAHGPNSGGSYRTEKYQTGIFNFEYKPGFQVGFGGEVPYDDWQIYSKYTWYHHQFQDSFVYGGANTQFGSSSAYQVNLFPAFVLKPDDFNSFLVNPSTMLSTWDLNLNWFFLELARNYYVGNHLSFRTHFGLRADINHQKVTQNFNLAQELVSNAGNDSPTQGIVRQRILSWGIGPRAGIGADYRLPYGLKVFGTLAGSLLYSQNTLKANQHAILAQNFTTVQNQTTQINESPHPTGHPNLEMGIGAGWGRSFYDNRWHLDLLLSYDLNALFDQNLFRELEMKATTVDVGDGDSARVLYHDLYLYGLTAKINLDW